MIAVDSCIKFTDSQVVKHVKRAVRFSSLCHPQFLWPRRPLAARRRITFPAIENFASRRHLKQECAEIILSDRSSRGSPFATCAARTGIDASQHAALCVGYGFRSPESSLNRKQKWFPEISQSSQPSPRLRKRCSMVADLGLCICGPCCGYSFFWTTCCVPQQQPCDVTTKVEWHSEFPREVSMCSVWANAFANRLCRMHLIRLSSALRSWAFL